MPHFAAGYVQQKVAEWVGEVERLSSVTQPYAAYAAFTHGLKHKWTIRTIPDISVLIQSLEDAIRHKFLPSLTGQNALNDETRELMAIPVRHGGLGIINPSHNNQIQHQSSEHITAPLVSLILQQSHTYPQEAKAEQLRVKEQAVKLRKQRDATTATELKDKLPNNMKRAMEASTEKGASSCLQPCPSQSMDLPSTRAPSETLCACDMVGDPLTYHPTASVARTLWNMHLYAPVADTPRFVTMN